MSGIPSKDASFVRGTPRNYALTKDETITDIRKVYKNGVTDSVMDKYKKYT